MYLVNLVFGELGKVKNPLVKQMTMLSFQKKEILGFSIMEPICNK